MAIPPRSGASAAPSASGTLAAVPAPRSAPRSSDAPSAVADREITPADATAEDVAGLAWIVREVTHVPGVLRLRHGRLSFESTRRVVFDGTPDELGLDLGRSPRAGLHVTAGQERLRVCVVRPSGAVAPCRELVDRAADGRPATDGEADAWSVWRPLLTSGPSATAARTRVRRAFSLPRSADHPCSP
ncbi:hypothetical protein Acsp06_30250 [Actinomycetospora sp. NBRC 106375]|uniref:hypothetical protein n=1 Tax=Actinomycetospora sp. NBRC 106375 TaxID=3032207 RepID=UPI00249FD60F|nr:hypothetical protein [Actinomycetospora sp. NBRC 106375]GLZ46840.1 hypothetical protein Acsp06_30250 [Actinomycetospora sp. NBRC 106375]